uniref:Oxidoreductase activity n=1 Tax=Candidozyma auris TaxID=498019 RepID=A0A0L0P8L9_CANAR
MGNYWKVHGSELDDQLYLRELREEYESGKRANADEIEGEISKIKYPQYLAKTKLEEAGTYNNHANPDHVKNDKGHLGDPTFKNLFKQGLEINKFDLSPNLGTEIDGVQLSELDEAGRNDLALFLETRGLAVFRNQDFRDKGPQFAKEFGQYFGPLHIHPVAYTAVDHPELLVTFRKAGDSKRWATEFSRETGLYRWHSDISFEEYPSSFSFFVALEAPPSGGDTVFVDLREAYRRLSPQVQKFFETLTVIHTNEYQQKFARLRNQLAKVKKVSYSEHPLVRTHPVTGEKSIFFSRGFILKIKGLKDSESAAILNFLEDHCLNNPEFQVRATHRGTDSRTVIAWDNRFLVHTATLDFLNHETSARHHFRITVLGEKPYFKEIKNKSEDDSDNEDKHPRAY